MSAGSERGASGTENAGRAIAVNKRVRYQRVAAHGRSERGRREGVVRGRRLGQRVAAEPVAVLELGQEGLTGTGNRTIRLERQLLIGRERHFTRQRRAGARIAGIGREQVNLVARRHRTGVGREYTDTERRSGAAAEGGGAADGRTIRVRADQIPVVACAGPGLAGTVAAGDQQQRNGDSRERPQPRVANPRQ